MPAPVLWPIRPNEQERIFLGYGYLTSVLASGKNKEQRAQLRRHPVGSIEFTYLCLDLIESQIAAVRLFGAQPRVWAVPLWCWPCPLTSDVSAGAMVLPCDTSDVPFQDPVGLGKYVLIYRDAATWELLRIDTVTGAAVGLVSGTAKAWSLGRDVVYPVRLGRLDARISKSWLTSQFLEGRLRFTFDSVKEPLSAEEEAILVGETLTPIRTATAQPGRRRPSRTHLIQALSAPAWTLVGNAPVPNAMVQPPRRRPSRAQLMQSYFAPPLP